MSEELKIIDDKICAWSNLWDKYVPIVLCQECKRQYIIPGIWYAICEECQGVSNENI